MKKGIVWISSLCCLLLLAACAGETASVETSAPMESVQEDGVIEVTPESEAASESESESEQEIVLQTVEAYTIEAGSLDTVEVACFLQDGEEAQDIVMETELTEEMLRTVGEYEIVLRYMEKLFTSKLVVQDTTAPVLELKNGSVELGNKISYKKLASFSDNAEGELILEIDSSAVNIEEPGAYSVVYRVTDGSGNSTEATNTITINKPKEPFSEERTKEMAREVLSSIVTEDMSAWDKAYAAFNWVNRSIRYIYTTGDMTSKYTGAFEGFRDRQGDCFVTYATLAVLLDELGISNQMVARYGGINDHYWCLVNIGSGWYHCDAGARLAQDPYRCFMQTDAQVKEYSDRYEVARPSRPKYYYFDETLYPERATTVVFESEIIW